ncbi:TB2/DP1, HVA22 family-domain-containing protein [Cubamyces lactineus]|nr:TB2/DP1, HVA22 family-domain-containing protein [Cubamyces lactineus]
MLMSMLSHLLSAWFAFLLPSYATWKALAHRPISEPDLERWGMYWAVVGAFVAVEYVSGWLLDWIPFYWEARTVFLLFLALPQTQGSTWVYTTYLQPFLLKNQADIDASIAAAQTNALAFVQSRLQVFWQTFWDLATRASANQAPGAPGTPASQQPSAAGASPVDVARSLWASYGSSLLGAFQQAARPATGAQPGAASAASAPAPAQSKPAASPYDVGSSSSVQVNQNAFSAEMVNGFSPAESATSLPPRFPEPEVPAA